MPRRPLPTLTGHNLPKLSQVKAPEPVNEKTLADFTRVVEQTGILKPQAPAEKNGD
jgi:hypothetical protein